MARPLRIEFPGALYHVISRGNEKRNIVRDDADRRKRLDWVCYERVLATFGREGGQARRAYGSTPI